MHRGTCAKPHVAAGFRLNVTSAVATREPIPASSYLEVLRLIRLGRSIRQACKELRANGVRGPNRSAFLAWCEKTPERYGQYTRAMHRRTALQADELDEIASSAGRDGDPAKRMADIQSARLRIDTRKWIAAKLLPKLYGDKLQHEHSGSVAITVDTGIPLLGTLPAARMLEDDTESAQGVLTYSVGAAVASPASPDRAAPSIAASPARSAGVESASRLLDE